MARTPGFESDPDVWFCFLFHVQYLENSGMMSLGDRKTHDSEY